jgi:hypothetical protein
MHPDSPHRRGELRSAGRPRAAVGANQRQRCHATVVEVRLAAVLLAGGRHDGSRRCRTIYPAYPATLAGPSTERRLRRCRNAIAAGRIFLKAKVASARRAFWSAVGRTADLTEHGVGTVPRGEVMRRHPEYLEPTPPYRGRLELGREKLHTRTRRSDAVEIRRIDPA